MKMKGPLREEKKSYHGHRERLRARFARVGIEGLNDYEALELLLTYAIPRRDTKPVAKRLLAEFGSLNEVVNAPAERLRRVKGVGQRSALLIRLVRDFQRESLHGAGARRVRLDSTQKAADYLRSEFATASEECFGALLLDPKARLLRFVLLAEGTIDRAVAYPRQVAEAAIQSGAAGIIVGHNHPRKASTPSETDRAMTRQLILSLSPIGVDLLDHIVLGEDGFYSFARTGELDAIREEYEAMIKKPRMNTNTH
jgi:DNA repair protein RadC